jgi:hypothetical protein
MIAEPSLHAAVRSVCGLSQAVRLLKIAFPPVRPRPSSAWSPTARRARRPSAARSATGCNASAMTTASR